MPFQILTVGHSRQTIEVFLDLITAARVTGIADVRSIPRSQRFPHFSRPTLVTSLAPRKGSYFFLGDRLGGRLDGHLCHPDGRPDYERMAMTPGFADGIAEVMDLAARYRLALLCSEHEPLECHRCLLVGRSLAEMGVGVGHILRSGIIEDHRETEERLIVARGPKEGDLFSTRAERLAAAYRAPVRPLPARARPTAERRPWRAKS